MLRRSSETWSGAGGESGFDCSGGCFLVDTAELVKEEI